MNSVSTNTSFTDVRIVKIYLKIHYITKFGQAIYLCGDDESLGMWDPCKALRLQWNQNHEWTICIKLPRISRKFEYKFLVNNYNEPSIHQAFWEPGENRIITKHLLLNGKKNEYFNQEFWGYRTIKLKLNHTLQPKERMMIIGSIPEIGSWKSPVLMKQQMKIDILTEEATQQWSISFIVDPLNFFFRYYYVIRNDDTGKMIWERGNGRYLKSADLSSIRQVLDQYDLHPIKVKTEIYSAIQARQFNKNGSFSSSKIPKSKIKQKNQGYSFADKEPSFFYYEEFGRLNKLDWNFVVQFQTYEINENILIGPYPQNEQDILYLKQQQVRAVLNLQTRLDMFHRGVNWEQIVDAYKRHNIVMKNYQIFDMDSEDFEKKSNKAVQILKKLINEYEYVYVHCTAGIGRAPSIVVLYLASILQYDLRDAIEFVKQKRQQFYINYCIVQIPQFIYNNKQSNIIQQCQKSRTKKHLYLIMDQVITDDKLSVSCFFEFYSNLEQIITICNQIYKQNQFKLIHCRSQLQHFEIEQSPCCIDLLISLINSKSIFNKSQNKINYIYKYHNFELSYNSKYS